MIVWGGWDNSALNTGGRYNPGTNSWTATSLTNAPAARYLHTAVWTGSQMIVWGGNAFPNNVNTGGRYDPTTNSWIATSIINAPAARTDHTAVWTGNEMIVFGGQGALNSGGRVRSCRRHLGCHAYRESARGTVGTHSSVDGQRNDRLGW